MRFLKVDRKTVDLVGNEKLKASASVTHLALPCNKAARAQVIPDIIRCYSQYVLPIDGHRFSVCCLILVDFAKLFFASVEAEPLSSLRRRILHQSFLVWFLDPVPCMEMLCKLSVKCVNFSLITYQYDNIILTNLQYCLYNMPFWMLLACVYCVHNSC